MTVTLLIPGQREPAAPHTAAERSAAPGAPGKGFKIAGTWLAFYRGSPARLIVGHVF